MDIIKKIPRFICYSIEMLFFKIVSLFYGHKFRNAWLICERGTEAKDNGYWFYKYMVENHKEIKCYYVIDPRHKKDYDKVKKLGDTIKFNSFAHKIALMHSPCFISTHIGYLIPWNYLLYKKVIDPFNKKSYIFLQHGITKDDISFFYNKKINPIDLFITATKPEYDSIFNNPNYGYQDEVVLTGFSRFDNLNKFKTKKQILFMPTWRSYILTPSYQKDNKDDKLFLDSNYYKHINSLLKNKDLIKMLENNNIDLIFYPHYEVQKYLNKFEIKSKRIKFADKENYDVQTLLKESLVLITDYSSVFFDFAYMKKPMLFYQFDEKEYFSKHYQKGYFDYRKHAFGKVITKEEKMIYSLEEIIKNNYEMELKYVTRVNKTFTYIDNNNSERIYGEIIKVLHNKKQI